MTERKKVCEFQWLGSLGGSGFVGSEIVIKILGEKTIFNKKYMKK